MMRTTILLAATCLALCSACGPKVKCKKLHTKMMTCAQNLVLKLRPDNQRKQAKAPDEETRKTIKDALEANVVRVKKLLTSQVTEQCKKHDGRAKDAGQINKCIETPDCDQFAACFAVYLREKRK